jgi:hypothetical protein
MAARLSAILTGRALLPGNIIFLLLKGKFWRSYVTLSSFITKLEPFILSVIENII